MKIENQFTTIAILLIFIIIGLIITININNERQEIIHYAYSDMGFEIGYLTAKHEIMIDEDIGEFSGEIYSIEPFFSFEMPPPLGYYYSNGTFVPNNFSVYKIDIDLTGFPWCDPHPYVNSDGTRYVTFRYCSNGVIPESGMYQFFYLDADVMEITHWEKT